jgi:hypothetical protein
VAQHSRLQPGQPVTAPGSARWDQRLASDQFAAEISEDGRAAGQACTVLLADAGGRTPDANTVCGDFVKDRDLAASGKLRNWWDTTRIESLRTKEDGAVSVTSARRALDCAGEPRRAQNRPVFCLQMQLRSCRSTQEQYNSVKSDPKREIPVYNSIRPHSSLKALTPDRYTSTACRSPWHPEPKARTST